MSRRRRHRLRTTTCESHRGPLSIVCSTSRSSSKWQSSCRRNSLNLDISTNNCPRRKDCSEKSFNSLNCAHRLTTFQVSASHSPFPRHQRPQYQCVLSSGLSSITINRILVSQMEADLHSQLYHTFYLLITDWLLFSK